ncbi:hypothetical protein J4414_02310 [Candidatus Woesearchaeota archaeon]|nr:hypothetical protein [Candidatus Woesearchaeota archaeon]
MENTYPLLNRAREYVSNFAEKIGFESKRFSEKDFAEMIGLQGKINDASNKIELDITDKQAYFSLGESLYSLFMDNYLIKRQVNENILNDSIEALSKVKDILSLQNSRRVLLDSLADNDKELLVRTLFYLSKAHLEKAHMACRKNDRGDVYFHLGLAEANKEIVTTYSDIAEVEIYYKRAEEIRNMLDNS